MHACLLVVDRQSVTQCVCNTCVRTNGVTREGQQPAELMPSLARNHSPASPWA